MGLKGSFVKDLFFFFSLYVVFVFNYVKVMFVKYLLMCLLVEFMFVYRIIFFELSEKKN